VTANVDMVAVTLERGGPVGAKDWMVVYADGDVRPILQAAPPIDRDETRALVRRLYPSRRVVETEDGTLFLANPPQDQLLAGCFPGLTVICTADVALDRPSTLDRRFLDEGKDRTVTLHAMHSVSDWFAFARWAPDGSLTRSLSLSPDNGVIENIGDPLPFEEPFWAGERPVEPEDDEGAYPLPFHPLELAEAALRALFGFTYEGDYLPDDPDLESVVLAGFRVQY
jgi:hypothetical protein